MKKRFITFLSGMVVGAVMFGGSVAYASGILADLSNNQIFVDIHTATNKANNFKSHKKSPFCKRRSGIDGHQSESTTVD